MQTADATGSPTKGQTLPGHGQHIQEIVERIYEKYKHLDDGKVATSNPELGKAEPKHFGICLATADGQVFRAGDWDKEFTIQSMCKPFAFQMALERVGIKETLKYVGVEPSGDPFNSVELDPKTTRPFNAMVNAGAIGVASLIKRSPVESGVQACVDKMSEAAGRNLRIDWERDAVREPDRQSQPRHRLRDAEFRDHR